MARFVTRVPLRWTDQDSYHHLNHAKAVTVLEEARIALFFDAAGEHGIAGFSGGLLVADLRVQYKRQVDYRSAPVAVAMWVDEVRAASFRISYELYDGPQESDPMAITAWTRMAMFDLAAQHPRRLTGEERAFLEKWDS